MSVLLPRPPDGEPRPHPAGVTVEVRVQAWAAMKPWLVSAAFMRPAAMVPCVRRAPDGPCRIPPGPIGVRSDAPA